MHELVTVQPGSKKLLLGNEAIVRGALEAGIAFALERQRLALSWLQWFICE